ncbi:acylphosphatase [Agromyces albus]|uniref:acylphosphatase n=1 Tax=Agromyces albus TaxID=205332 RepID=UPI0027812D09|nr:acylphosphatase [Agromyces albus]MDQ0573996.1 acylphosphatase [Agromyces albus]
MIRRSIVVHGNVQGVGFRYSARREAERLGVAGWVRNRPDGSVEAEIEGDEASVTELIDWFTAGPPGAIVSGTDVAEREPLGEHAFRIIGWPVAG